MLDAINQLQKRFRDWLGLPEGIAAVFVAIIGVAVVLLLAFVVNRLYLMPPLQATSECETNSGCMSTSLDTL